MIKIALAEDNDFLADSIQEKITFYEELKFKFRGKNGAELIGKLASDGNVDLVLMDIQMPEMDGIKATEIIKSRHPQIKVIILTVFDDDENIFRSIKAGADGYLLKDTEPDALFNGIVTVMDGGASITPSIALKTLELLRKAENPNIKPEAEDFELSKRESEILTQISKGLNHHQIAKNLIISSATVRKHIENVYKKLRVHNKVEAVQVAIQNKLI